MRFFAVAGGVGAALVSWSALAGERDASLLQNLQWRSIGPFRGGRVLAVAGAPDRPERFYFGAVNGGVWRTDDAGRTWAPIFDDAPTGAIGALAVSPSAPDTVYVGTGEADMRSDIAQGVGMFRSDDAGKHWVPVGLRDTQQIGRILVDPRDSKVLLVAALGHPYGPNAERGVFRSADGGAHWDRTLFHDADTGAIDIAFQPGNPDVVYAALWQTRRPPWNVYPPSSGPGSGLYKSTDGGRHWAALVGHGLPAAPGRIGIAVTPARADRVYAIVDTRDGAAGAGLYRSDDAGGTWVRVSEDHRIMERAWYFSGITADPKNADTVYVCDTVVLRSDDGGAHFRAIKGDPTGDDYHSLWIDPANPERRILGVDQGALVSVNGGQSWSSWFNQPTGQFYHVSTDNRFPYRVYGAQQDSGAADVPSRTDAPMIGALGDGIGMADFHESAAGGESDNIAPDPDDPDTVFGGRVDRLDRRSGQLRSVDPTLAFPDNYRSTWTLPLSFGPDHALYFSNQRIFRTGDGGSHWQVLSPDLTRPDPGVPATLDAPTRADVPEAGARRGVVYALAPSPLDARQMWAGTDDGLIWRTQDGGAHWADVTPAEIGPWSKIGTLDASHFDVAVAYAAVDRHRLDDQTPHAYRTADGGRSWTAIVAGLAGAVNVVREDTRRRGLLFAGTENGAFVSFDDGTAWQPLQRGLPRTSVRDITIHGDDLVIATHGRGFYILDDMSELRALAGDGGAQARLFPPADAIRLHPPAFTGTPMPRDEALALNPPNGAIIDFVLPQGIAGPVDIAILDVDGKIVRRFGSADAATAPDAAALPVAPEWLPAAVRPLVQPGAQRLVWDLHYTRPAGLEGGDPAPEGVWAPPGRYTVRLTTASGVLSQNFQVLPDPRLRLGAGDLRAEFALARDIEGARVRARALLAQAGTLRKTLSGDAARLAALDVLVDAPPDNPGAGSTAAPRHVDGLADISQRLDHLALAVDGADAAPTDDARTGFRLASDALATAAAKWASFTSGASVR